MIFAEERFRSADKLLKTLNHFIDYEATEYVPHADEFFCSFCLTAHAKMSKDINHLEGCPVPAIQLSLSKLKATRDKEFAAII